MHDEQILGEYQRLVTGTGFVEMPRTRIVVTGEDRHSFLHNFCTVDVKSLQPGQCAEGFVLNGKGKLIGHAHFIVGDNQIVILTIPGQFDVLRCIRPR